MTRVDGSFDVLDDDCVLEVLKYLTLNRRLTLATVNKRWTELSNRAWAAQKVVKIIYANCFDLRELFVNFCQNKCHQASCCDLLIVRQDSCELSDCLKLCPNLKALHWEVQSDVNFGRSLTRLCPNLEHLVINDINPVVSLTQFKLWAQLRCFSFKSFRDKLYGNICLRNNDLDLLAVLIKGACQLTAFEFEGYVTKELVQVLRTKQLEHLAFNRMHRELQSLDLAPIWPELKLFSTSDETICRKEVGDIAKLEHLELSSKNFKQPLDLTVSAKLTGLTLIGGNFDLTLNDLSGQLIDQLLKLTALRSISLIKVRINFSSFQQILSCCHKLRLIEIEITGETYGVFYWNEMFIYARKHPKRHIYVFSYFKHDITGPQRQMMPANVIVVNKYCKK